MQPTREKGGSHDLTPRHALASQVNLLAIREKELNYYTQNCQAVGTQAALLAGFAYSGLTQVSIPHERAYALQLAYLLVTTTAMCFELIAVLNTTLLSMMGPGLALRGPDGSMHPAVDGMMKEYRTAYYCFVLGLVFFHFSAALYSWLIMVHWAVSTMVTLCICGSLWLLVRYAKRVYMRFRLPAELVITGLFHSDDVAAAAGPVPAGKGAGVMGVSGDQAQLIAAAAQS
jgi:hypothetical protein